MTANRVYLYDSTLRDGAQARGVDFTVSDKQAIARQLDKFGIDYIEGGWPGANPNDDAFFADLPETKAKVAAFGMTRRAGRSADNDPGLSALLDVGTPTICIVGKSWDFQVEMALNISKQENLSMIADSIARIVAQGREAVFDAEHFFDGYKANPEFALACIKAAYDAGARWIVLCDTNGGSLPHEVEQIIREITPHVAGENLGIHCHNDTENAVANSLAAVRAGARQVQGTLNGIGERCGNANLTAIIPTLMLKMGMETGVHVDKLPQLVQLSRFLDDRLNRAPNPHAAYVGSAAFAHKGGLHVSAMAKDSRTYEHIAPESVGNQRSILVSDKAGRSNILSRMKELGLEDALESEHIDELVAEIKRRETQGFAYEDADASFELLVRRRQGGVPQFFDIDGYRVMDERRHNAAGQLVNIAEAVVKLSIEGEAVMTVAEGNGPVNALDKAMRAALTKKYPAVTNMRLADYKVRILTPSDATKAVTRVMIESRDEKGNVWTTIGVSPNVINASFMALFDSITYLLMLERKQEAA
ncbi:MAG: citramalate synthase [Alphaproteobacteria bacterium]|nr:citramalate synthase [Alphaproteobacteria bacterium]